MMSKWALLTAACGLLAAFCAGAPTIARAQGVITQPRLQIYAGPLHHEYLGCLNCDQYDNTSIWNTYSAAGWLNDFADHSHFAMYRAPYGRYSACDPNAADPPRLIDNSLKFYGYLNVQTRRIDGICGPNGSKDICAKLTLMCVTRNDPTQQQ
jgi:hypothetical protein